MDKRTFLKSAFLVTGGLFTSGLFKLKAAKARVKWDGIFRLPKLKYPFNALEPFADADTLKEHYLKHHSAYVDNLNKAVAKNGIRGKSAYEFLGEISKYDKDFQNNCAGFFNHQLFWKILAAPDGKQPSLILQTAIERDFGSFGSFKSDFYKATESVSGSGWVWLVTNKAGRLKVTATLNNDNPLMECAKEKGFPVMCLDLWEHAYYLRDKSRRSDYIETFWSVVNWDVVSNRYNNRSKLRFD